MARYWAELDDNNVVLRVIVAEEHEVQELGGTWLETFQGRQIVVPGQPAVPRSMHFASVGDIYSEQYDTFIKPKPNNSYVFDETELIWVPPLPYPSDNGTIVDGKERTYVWNDDEETWDISDKYVTSPIK